MVQLFEGGIRENINITDVHSSGKCVGTYNSKNLYIDFTIPGEKVNVRLDRKKKGFYSGITEDILSPSEFRINPPCKHFGICGGCNWQHISYPHQLTLKKKILEKALIKYSIPYKTILPVISSPALSHFRNKTEYSFAEKGICNVNDTLQFSEKVSGFHPLSRRDLTLEITDCFLQHAPGQHVYEIVRYSALKLNIPFYNYETRDGLLRNLVIRTSTSGSLMAILGFIKNEPNSINNLLEDINKQLPDGVLLFYTLVTSPEKGYTDGEIVPFHHKQEYLQEITNNLEFRYGPKSFYQPNPEQASNIFRKIRELANLQGNEFVIDLYTGVGSIALSLAGKANKILGIEGSDEAIRFATINAKLNNITNAEFITGDILLTFNNQFVDAYGKPDIIVLDPPRSGTLIEIKKTILYARPEKIIYVSCNPVSLAFDLTMLTNGYSVSEIQPFDMFPHTHHLETVVLLEKIY